MRIQFVCMPWIEGNVIFGHEFQSSSSTCTKKTNFQKTKKKADRQRKKKTRDHGILEETLVPDDFLGF